MTTSCSAWIVATMSRISPVRARSSSASSGSGMPPCDAAQHAVGVVEDLVEEVGELVAVMQEPAAALQAERVGTRRPVERRRHRRPPVDDDRVARRRPRRGGARRTSVSPASSSMRPKQSASPPDVELREPLAEVHGCRVGVGVAAAGVVERGLEHDAVRPCMAASDS